MWIIRTFAWHFRAQLMLVIAAFGADTAWNFVSAFWGFTVLALAMTQLGCWMAHNASQASAKAQQLQARLDTVVIPRLPFPQATPGPGGNTSYNPGNTSYTTGNSSYDIGSGTDGIGGADNGSNTSGQIGGASAHYHAMAHGHYYGGLATDFNALRDTASSHISAFNNHIGDHGNLVVAVQTLRSSYSNTVTDHNSVVTTLQNANVTH